MTNKKRPLSTPHYLFLINGLTLCGGVVFFIMITLSTLEKTANIQTTENLRTFAYVIEQLIQNQQLEPIKENQELFFHSIDRLVRETASHDADFRITIIDKDGTVVADSDVELSTMENHSNRHEVREALAGREASEIRISSVYHETQIYYAIPLVTQGRNMALRLSIPIRRNVFFSST